MGVEIWFLSCYTGVKRLLALEWKDGVGSIYAIQSILFVELKANMKITFAIHMHLNIDIMVDVLPFECCRPSLE